jgi:hypothetical protein
MGRFARAPHSLATSTRGNPRRFTTAGVFLLDEAARFADQSTLIP